MISRDLLAVAGTGLVTSVGLSAPSSCAAIRAGVTNPAQTHFIDMEGEPLMGHAVTLDEPWTGRAKLLAMLVMAIEECLADVPPAMWPEIPVLLCVAEPDRPGRLDGLDLEFLDELASALKSPLGQHSAVVARGRVSVGVALQYARRLVHQEGVRSVLVCAADSLLHWPSLSAYEEEARLLTSTVSNGFLPGEGAGALLITRPSGDPQLVCAGLGFSREHAHVRSEQPLRANGLVAAIGAALTEAGCSMHDLDFRIADVSGEQYYFKEAALALARVLRQTKEEFDIWHPADCIGESGALAGVAMVAVADAACRKGYAPGGGILLHMSNDSGERAAAVFHYEGRP